MVDYARIRDAYYVQGKNMAQIEREYGHSYWTIRKALDEPVPRPYTRQDPKAAPVLGPYMAQVDELLAENERLPRKQRYTSHKIFQQIQAKGYPGAESSVRRYVSQRRKRLRRPKLFLPLTFDPGMDAQVDWGEAQVVMAGEPMTVNLFVMRLCYARKLFVMAFPSQRQEAFFLGHVQAFAHFGGVPKRISYDNLKTAVFKILQGRGREEQHSFLHLRSHYLFDSRFCTPGEGHEKGGVESDVGYSRRNFLTPPPSVADFAELNELLLAACTADEARRVDRLPDTIGERWRAEQPHLRPLPDHAFVCCISREVTLNKYSQVTFETNRYSVPVDQARKRLTLRAYPFKVEILADNKVLASHPRSYQRQQDLLDPLHYLSLLAQRPGAFEHAQPLRQWRASWSPAYEALLALLRQRHSAENRAVRTFIQILQLHETHPAALVHQAIEQAVAGQIVSLEGVRFCLNRLLDPTPAAPTLDLADRPQLAAVGSPIPHLSQYDRFLGEVLQ